MAEGWTRHLWGETIEPYSAGVEAHGMNHHAVKVMKEAGVDITSQYSKLVEDLEGIDFDVMITLCDNAKKRCPYFPSNSVLIHHGFDDPFDARGSEEEILSVYRKVRDQIKAYVETFGQILNDLKKSNFKH
jgi:arsenate reductase (thioredoxin)